MPALERSKPPHVRVRPLSVSPDGRSGPVLHRQHTVAQFWSTHPMKHDRLIYRRLSRSYQYYIGSQYAMACDKASTRRVDIALNASRNVWSVALGKSLYT